MNWKKSAFITTILCGLCCSLLQGESSISSTKWKFSVLNQVVTGQSPFPCPPPFTDPDSFPYPNTQIEPSIAVGRNPVDPSHPMVVIGYQEDRYSTLGGASSDYMIISLDGGKKFGNPIPVPAVQCFNGPFERISDPHVRITNQGEILYSTLPFDIVADGLRSVAISKYNVRKKKFIYTKYLQTIDLYNFPYAATDYDDVAIDPQDPSGKLAYVTWDLITYPNNGPVSTSLFRLSKTTDGVHWSTPIDINPFPPSTIVQYGNDVGPQYIALDFLNNPGKKFSKLLATFALTTNQDFDIPPYTQAQYSYSMVSDDQGKTWTNAIPLNNTVNDVIGQVVDPDNTNAPIRSGGGGTIVDRERNIIYYVSQEHSLVYDGKPTQIILYYSLDDAASWNLVGPINTVLSTQAFNPGVCLIDEGRIAVSYYDFRNHTTSDPTGPLQTDRWMDIYYFDKISKTLTLETELKLTDTSFNFRNAPRVFGVVITEPGFFLSDFMEQVYFERKIYNVYPIVPQGSGPNSAHLQLSIVKQERPIPGNE